MLIANPRLSKLSKKSELGLIIYERLYQLGKNQCWLAQQTGVSGAYISFVMNGKSTPSPVLTKKIAETLEVDVTVLVRAIFSAS